MFIIKTLSTECVHVTRLSTRLDGERGENRTVDSKRNETQNSLVKLCGGSPLVLGVGRYVGQKGGAADEFGIFAHEAVPGVVAVLPGQVGCEGGEQVVQGPRDNHVVVEAHV